ncbi:MAG: hypothetical protein ACJAWK_000554 [Candidatus Azotimanducaceae bacterium]|jgi:hypothetical protein
MPQRDVQPLVSDFSPAVAYSAELKVTDLWIFVAPAKRTCLGFTHHADNVDYPFSVMHQDAITIARLAL